METTEFVKIKLNLGKNNLDFIGPHKEVYFSGSCALGSFWHRHNDPSLLLQRTLGRHSKADVKLSIKDRVGAADILS